MNTTNLNLLNEFYKSRENDIASLEESDRQNLEELLKERKLRNEKLEIAIQSIPDGFTEIIHNIRIGIENKLEIENKVNGYFNEKYYKIGFSDAINLIMECKKY